MQELDADKSGYLDNEELHKVVDFMYHTLGNNTHKTYNAQHKHTPDPDFSNVQPIKPHPIKTSLHAPCIA